MFHLTDSKLSSSHLLPCLAAWLEGEGGWRRRGIREPIPVRKLLAVFFCQPPAAASTFSFVCNPFVSSSEGYAGVGARQTIKQRSQPRTIFSSNEAYFLSAYHPPNRSPHRALFINIENLLSYSIPRDKLISININRKQSACT